MWQAIRAASSDAVMLMWCCDASNRAAAACTVQGSHAAVSTYLPHDAHIRQTSNSLIASCTQPHTTSRQGINPSTASPAAGMVDGCTCSSSATLAHAHHQPSATTPSQRHPGMMITTSCALLRLLQAQPAALQCWRSRGPQHSAQPGDAEADAAVKGRQPQAGRCACLRAQAQRRKPCGSSSTAGGITQKEGRRPACQG